VLLGTVEVKRITTDETGTFSVKFTIAPDVLNPVTFIAKDPSGNTVSKSYSVLSDTTRPKITLQKLPDIIGDKQFSLNGTISENSSIEVLLNNKSIHSSIGTSFEAKLNVNEGTNNLVVTATDSAGWVTSLTKKLNSDTEAPTVKFDVSKGTEYYEFQAESSITGTTEPGATVYLYVFVPQTQETRLRFDRALQKVTANSEGKFIFEEVDFSGLGTSTIDTLSPTHLPPGLEGIILPKLDRIQQAQRVNYRVYVLAEDKSGKVGHATKTVYVNSCSSGDYAFDVFVPPQFPVQPLKLNPLLMKEGRESMSVVYNLTYRGAALPTINTNTGDTENPYRISNVKFEKACTKANADKDDFNIGCKLAPRLLNGKSIKSDKTMWFLETPLLRTEDFSEITDDVLTEFTKRQLKIPLKIVVNYQERNVDGSWQAKTQVECREIGSFVDIPIDSSLLVPDSLAEYTVSATNETLHQINRVKKILDPLVKWTGVSCYGSWLTKGVLKINRVVASWYESFTQKGSKDKPACPTPSKQREMYLKSTLDDWKKLQSKHPNAAASIPIDFNNAEELKKKTLDEACPSTAAAWEREAFFDKLYKTTCDRFFCRSSPSRWTETETEEDVKKVVLDQQQCAASSNCITMTPVENCQNELKKNPAAGEIVRVRQEKGSFTCWRDREGTLYYHCTENDADVECKKRAESLEEKGVWILKPVLSIGKSKPKILALKGELNNVACVAQDRKCSSVCKRKQGYVSSKSGFKQSGTKYVAGGSCYKENAQGKLEGVNGVKTHASAFTAGYTQDCFIAEDTGDKYQCVCEQDQDILKKQSKKGSREALRMEKDVAEPWMYRQEKVYKESNGDKGTYYPEWRYYGGRDFTAAFGLNHVADLVGEKTNARINPRDYVGAWQTMCLPRINNQLTVAQSVLTQFQNCVIQAQNSEFQDAGICKTFFATNVCGWLYKGISAFTNQCSPFTFDDVEGFEELGDGGISAFSRAFKQGVPEALTSSVNELKDDYGAHAQEQFKVGTQGVAQSMCLFAFGYDFPTDFDFITDAAYSTPMKTSVSPLIANREFTSFDPIRGVPEFTYNLGTLVIPGCPLRGYKSSFVCIGTNDLGKPGIDQSCSGQGCDCLQASNQNSPFEAEKTKVIPSGTKNGVFPQFQAIDIPYKNPLQVESNFRYDHVKLELYLESGVDPKECFDESVATNVGGEIYFPLSHVEGREFAQCQVHGSTGRYICPALSQIFQQGGAFLEHPFVQCYDKREDEFVDCQQPNVILVDEEIVVKPYLSAIQSDSCLVISDNKGNVKHNILLPQSPVPIAPRISLGKATANLLTGGQVGTIRKVDSQSVSGCGGNGGQINQIGFSQTSTKSRTMPFEFTRISGKYQLQVPHGITVIPGTDSFDINTNRYLTKKGEITLSTSDVNKATFSVDGYRFNQVLGTPSQSHGKCVYRTVPSYGGKISKVGVGSTRIKIELKQPGPGNSCWKSTKLVDKNPLGKNVHSQSIRIQSAKMESQSVITLHQDFMNGNYHLVASKAQDIIKQEESTMEDALALYYWSASLVMQGIGNHNSEIVSLLKIFFKRELQGKKLSNYPQGVVGFDEYKKIRTYLCLVDQQVGSQNQNLCKGVVSSGTLCASSTGLKPGFKKPTGWNSYACKDSKAKGCLAYTQYVPKGVTGRGCPSSQLCCPT